VLRSPHFVDEEVGEAHTHAVYMYRLSSSRSLIYFVQFNSLPLGKQRRHVGGPRQMLQEAEVRRTQLSPPGFTIQSLFFLSCGV